MSQDPFYLIRERMSVKVKMRTEKHGDDDVNAYDVMLCGAFANAILLKLSRDLRPSLYTQEQSDLLDGQTFNTLRFPELGSLDWTLAMVRMTLVIHDGDDEGESLELTNRDADKFSFSLLPGGTVNLSLRIKLGEIEDEDDLLKLLRASNQQLLISLHQAPVEGMQDNFDKVETITKEPMSDERKHAEKAFYNPAGAQTPDEVVGDEQAETEEEGA